MGSALIVLIAYLAISLLFEVVRRAFYYVIFGRAFPPRRRRPRRSLPAEESRPSLPPS